MGLPLYIAPVESDVREKPARKDPSAHARSAIRRSHRNGEHRGAEGRSVGRYYVPSIDREERTTAPLRAIERLRATGTTDETSSSPAHAEGSSSNPQASGATGSTTGPNRERPAPDVVVRRSGGLDERALAVMGERWANLYTGANPNPSRDDPLSGSVPHYALLQSSRANRAGNRSSRAYLAERFAALDRGPRSVRYRMQGSSPRRSGPMSNSATRERTRASPTPPLHYWSERSSRLDGLGDRNRSLSPEGDSVWDTLLTTITPDPQPPSVGSSFASTTASASAGHSQSTVAAGSSSTSLSAPDTPGESGFDQNCESGCENSDTDPDEDEEPTERNPGRMRFHIAGRSWADVAGQSNISSSSDDPQEISGDLRRIVRHLVRREDIPDEWWAEVGLSRTLSREAAN